MKSSVELLLRNEVGAMARLQVAVNTTDKFTHHNIFKAIAFGDFEILPTETSKQYTENLEQGNGEPLALKFFLLGAEYEKIPFTQNGSLVPYICTIDIPEIEEQSEIFESIAVKSI